MLLTYLFLVLWLSSDNKIRPILSIGLFRKAIMINDVKNMTIVSTSWWYVNTCPTSSSMLYKVGGSEAVEVQLSERKRVQIGTDEPEALLNAIQSVNMALVMKSSEIPSYERNHRISYDGNAPTRIDKVLK